MERTFNVALNLNDIKTNHKYVEEYLHEWFKQYKLRVDCYITCYSEKFIIKLTFVNPTGNYSLTIPESLLMNLDSESNVKLFLEHECRKIALLMMQDQLAILANESKVIETDKIESLFIAYNPKVINKEMKNNLLEEFFKILTVVNL